MGGFFLSKNTCLRGISCRMKHSYVAKTMRLNPQCMGFWEHLLGSNGHQPPTKGSSLVMWCCMYSYFKPIKRHPIVHPTLIHTMRNAPHLMHSFQSYELSLRCKYESYAMFTLIDVHEMKWFPKLLNIWWWNWRGFCYIEFHIHVIHW